MKLWIDKELFQWEKDRKVYVEYLKNETPLKALEFYNDKSVVSDTVQIENNFAMIPNHLLKFSLPITALGCAEAEENDYPLVRKSFKVIPRPRPEYYIDDSNEPNLPIVPEDDQVIFDGGEEK